MGWNTYITVNNDRLDELDDPEFGRKLRDAILRQACSKEQTRANGLPGVLIMAQEHADTILILAGGSMQPLLGCGQWRDSPHELLKKVAEQHGFSLVKKRKQLPYPSIVERCDDCQGKKKEP